MTSNFAPQHDARGADDPVHGPFVLRIIERMTVLFVMRHVKLGPGRDVDAAALMKLIRTAYADIKGRLKA